MTLNNLEFPKRVFSEFFAIFSCMHSSTLNRDEMSRDHAMLERTKFLALNVDISSLSPDPLG